MQKDGELETFRHQKTRTPRTPKRHPKSRNPKPPNLKSLDPNPQTKRTLNTKKTTKLRPRAGELDLIFAKKRGERVCKPPPGLLFALEPQKNKK